MRQEGQLVSVVIPAHNAAATLDLTLRSFRGQTHRKLEIIVVDDGSTDATRGLAERHAAADVRVRVLHQDNAGVAAARNLGWRSSISALIAFVDADDLWSPDKIERQLEALRTADPRTGLVYCWFNTLDAASRIVGAPDGPTWQGDVMDALLGSNFVGNGSAALIRREALEAAGGFYAHLRSRGAQGCEDYLLYLRVAESYHFALVPQHLVGYRVGPANMSSDRPRMLRSWMLVAQQMRERHPHRAHTIRAGLCNYALWLVADATAQRHHGQRWSVLRLLLRQHAGQAVQVAWHGIVRPSLVRAKARLLGAAPGSRVRVDKRIGNTFEIGNAPCP
jgi:glycosyltransferase involved in cell wall biosynthesis